MSGVAAGREIQQDDAVGNAQATCDTTVTQPATVSGLVLKVKETWVPVADVWSAQFLSTSSGTFNVNKLPYHTLPEELRSLEPDYGDTDAFNLQLAKTQYHVWAPLKPTVLQLSISTHDINILYDASRSAVVTGQFPLRLKEELEGVAAELKLPSSAQGYFVRLDGMSLKEGVLNAGPFMDGRDIVLGIITSDRVQKHFEGLRLGGNQKDCILYVFPWDDRVNPKWEFRVFVYQGRITALSQYKWTQDVGWWERRSAMPAIIKSIMTLHTSHIVQSCEHMHLPPSYVLDVWVEKGSNEAHLIEINSFGAQMAAGSALFHWLSDWRHLYGYEEGVEVRLVAPESLGQDRFSVDYEVPMG